MKVIEVKVTTQQKNKLKKGETIRVSPKQVKGAGLMLVINPNKYNALTKAFDSNRGMMFQLDDDELEVNMNPEMIDDDEVVEAIEGQGIMAGGGKRAKKGYAPRTEEEKRARKKRKKKKKKGDDPFAEIGKIGYDIEQSAKDTGREVGKVGYDIEQGAKDTGYAVQEQVEEVGKQMKGISKAVLGKRATRALLDMGYELRDVAREVGEDLIKEVEALGDEVLGEFLEEFENLTNEAKETIRKLDQAGKIISRNITPDKWGNLIKEIPRFYRAELRDTIVGELLRTAIRKGSKMLIESAIKAMYSNPYTAPLAPVADLAYKAYGKEAIEELVKVSGAGVRAGGDGVMAGGKLTKPGDIKRKIKDLNYTLKSRYSSPQVKKQARKELAILEARLKRIQEARLKKTQGVDSDTDTDSESDDDMVGSGFSIPKAPSEIRRAIDKLKKELKKLKDKPFVGDVVKEIKKQIQTLKKALDRVEGRGVRAGGDGVYAGNGVMAGGQAQCVSMQTRPPIPNFLLKKQLMLPVDPSEGAGVFAGSGHCTGMMVGSGGGGVIMGLDKPIVAGVVRPRPIFASTLLNKSV